MSRKVKLNYTACVNTDGSVSVNFYGSSKKMDVMLDFMQATGDLDDYVKNSQELEIDNEGNLIEGLTEVEDKILAALESESDQESDYALACKDWLVEIKEEMMIEETV